MGSRFLKVKFWEGGDRSVRNRKLRRNGFRNNLGRVINK